MPVGEKFAPHIGQQRKKPPRPPASPPRSGEDVRLGTPPPAVAQPPRSGEDTRLGSPTTQPSFTGTPIPVLQAYGYSGSVHDLNARVGAIVGAFQNRFGALPSFGHVFNVLTSQVDDFKGLYDQVPRSNAEALSKSSLAQHKQENPYEYFVKNDQGELIINSPLMEKIRNSIAASPPKPGQLEATRKDLIHASKQYPTVKAGEVIPLNSVSPEELSAAVKNIDDWVGESRLKVSADGIPAKEIDQLVAQAEQSRGYAEDKARKSAQVALMGQQVTTVKKAQQELNDRMGTALPVTGIFNDDWQKAVGNWMSSPSYYRQAAIWQAQQSGFGNDYARFKKAVDFKSHAVKKHGFVQYALNALPLHVYSHGGGWGIASGIFDDVVRPNSLGFSTPFHALTHTAGLALDTTGGTITQAKAYAVAGNAFAMDMGLYSHGKHGKTLAQAKEDFRKRLINTDPTWLHVLFPHMGDHPKGLLGQVDQATNLAADLFLLRKVNFTGEKVAVGDLSAALRSSRIRVGSHWAYQDLKAGNIGRASSMLEGGSGAEKLASFARPLIEKGKLTEQEFHNHVSELYATGSTTLKYGTRDVTVENAARPFDSLRIDTLPTSGGATFAAKRGIRAKLDKVDAQIRTKPWLPDQAANFISGVRAEFSHAVPVSARNYFEPRLPERVHDLVLREFKNAKLANEFESRLVRLRATENVVGIQKLDDQLSQMLRAKYPEGREADISTPFEPILETEAPSRFQAFGVARQGQREFDGAGDAFAGLHNMARVTNRAFNKVASYSSRLIIASPILAWKHLTDYFRRAVAQGSIRPGLSAEQLQAKAEIEAIVKANPEIARQLDTFLARSKNSEVRYMTGNGATLRAPGADSFSTGEKFDRPHYMTGAGGYLRRRVQSKALAAYQASTEADLSPLVNLVLHDRQFQGLYRAAKKSSKVAFEDPGISADEYAQVLWNQYQEIQDAAAKAGQPDFLSSAAQVLEKNRGAGADEALGDFITQARVDFKVHKAEVKRIGGFDALSSKVIGTIMIANKWNRGKLAQRAMYQAFADLKAAGAGDTDALLTSMSGAEKLVSHHMLDFANRLQVEQDFRWLSYFATKHRLYWKWVLSTFARHPGYAALVYDFSKLLDSNGNLNLTSPFSVPGVGNKLAIPGARLTWVPGQDYSELSPPAKAIQGVATGHGFFESARGTFGNVFTRNDTALRLMVRWGKMEGGSPATYAQAVAGMDDKTKSGLYKAFNDYANHFYEEHGHYPSESNAVKHVLWLYSGEELWRANLPLPVQTQYSTAPSQKELGQYLKLNDPADRHEYLNKHPELAASFGVYKNPNHYQHNREFFRQFNSVRDSFRNERRAIWAKAQEQGYWTPDLQKQSKQSSTVYSGAINKLVLQDAAQTGKITEEGHRLLLNPRTNYSKIDPDQYITQRGLWGKTIATDPNLNFAGQIHKLFPNIPFKQVSHASGGFNLAQARQELKLLNSDYAKATYGNDPEAQSQLKSRKQELLQYVSDFQGAPTNPVSKAMREYRDKYANPFWKAYEKRWQKINALPKGKKDVAYAEFRAWRDAQDKQVTIGGVKFPSPIRSAWSNLDPVTRKQNLARIAASDWGHLADYEKELLTGKKVPKDVSAGWAYFEDGWAKYRQANPGARVAANQKLYVAKQADKQYPGFYKDYLFSLKNKERRFESTLLYQNMPTDTRAKYDQNIGQYAKRFKAELTSRNYTSAQAVGVWKNYIDQQITPWLGQPEQTRLRKELAPYGPDFLYSLVG